MEIMSIPEKLKSQTSVCKYTDTMKMETKETYRTYGVIP